jgi:hypothetical protein
MPCLIVTIALFMPRLTLVIIWLFTKWTGAFETRIWPLLGWIFMPYTTICYLISSCATDGHINGIWVFLIVVGVFCDLIASTTSTSVEK